MDKQSCSQYTYRRSIVIGPQWWKSILWGNFTIECLMSISCTNIITFVGFAEFSTPSSLSSTRFTNARPDCWEQFTLPQTQTYTLTLPSPTQLDDHNRVATNPQVNRSPTWGNFRNIRISARWSKQWFNTQELPQLSRAWAIRKSIWTCLEEHKENFEGYLWAQTCKKKRKKQRNPCRYLNKCRDQDPSLSQLVSRSCNS